MGSGSADTSEAETARRASETTLDDVDHPLFSRLYSVATPLEWLFAPHRDWLATDLSGRVLDLGAGVGGMFRPVAERAGESLEYHALEPDATMRHAARKEARAVDLPVDIRAGRAEALPYPDACFDVVLSSVVFCTIEDPERALEEIARVLKPGGELRFFEHVRADGWRERGQTLLNPVWKRVGGGCTLDRDTVGLFVSHEAFAVERIDRLEFGVFPAKPFVRGRLRRRTLPS